MGSLSNSWRSSAIRARRVCFMALLSTAEQSQPGWGGRHRACLSAGKVRFRVGGAHNRANRARVESVRELRRCPTLASSAGAPRTSLRGSGGAPQRHEAHPPRTPLFQDGGRRMAEGGLSEASWPLSTGHHPRPSDADSQASNRRFSFNMACQSCARVTPSMLKAVMHSSSRPRRVFSASTACDSALRTALP